MRHLGHMSAPWYLISCANMRTAQLPASWSSLAQFMQQNMLGLEPISSPDLTELSLGQPLVVGICFVAGRSLPSGAFRSPVGLSHLLQLELLSRHLSDLWVLLYLIFCPDLRAAQLPASWSSQTGLHAQTLRAKACERSALAGICSILQADQPTCCFEDA